MKALIAYFSAEFGVTAGVAKELVALDFGFAKEVFVVGGELTHFFTGLFGGVKGVGNGFFAFVESFEEHRPAPFAKDEYQHTKGD